MAAMFNFKIIKKDNKSRARLGLLETPHGLIHTPAFVPVATKGALRGLSFETAAGDGAEIFMLNTFHLFQSNRYEIIRQRGGLHKFLNLNYPLMTDSGGFQVFSLGFGMEKKVGKLMSGQSLRGAFRRPSGHGSNAFRIVSESVGERARGLGRPPRWGGRAGHEQGVAHSSSNLVKIDGEGVTFRSPSDGQQLRLTPELSIRIQQQLGADIIFAFDECTSPLHDYAYTKQALERTHQWAKVSFGTFQKLQKLQNCKQALFGIIQGGRFKDLRIESAKFISSLPFFGFGIGGSFGSSYGDSKKNMREVLDWIMPYLPENKPRHLLGIGEVDDLFEAVERGVDLFDCVSPTRLARHGEAFTFQGRLNLKSSKYLKTRIRAEINADSRRRFNKDPIDPQCQCRICQRHSRAYICHLLKEKEIYGLMLLTEHNLAWILNLMKQLRKSVRDDSFEQLKKRVLKFRK